jgi:putative ATPase
MDDMHIPLAEKLRPMDLDDYVGQRHLTGEGAPLRRMIESGRLSSMIFWGPPGSGKTTLAHIIAGRLKRPFFTLSAISSGVKDVREVIDNAAKNNSPAILFIDEIHRFNKAQQDSLLGAVEKGIITLIGATTENPSFEVISPLLSRCQIYILKPFDEEDIDVLIRKGSTYLEQSLHKTVRVTEKEALWQISGGDARKLLNALELVVSLSEEQDIMVTNGLVLEVVQRNMALYDKTGEQHYDIISAFIKSIRGSDPNAAVYWLARMIHAGEDVKFIARRMLILSSEDIGLANPNALLLAQTCFEAVNVIGYPESRIILSETAIYLACSQKSNSSYLAIEAALSLAASQGDLPVPLHLRNAPTKLMKKLDYGKNYKYAHDFQGNFVAQQFMPDKLKGEALYSPGNNQREKEAREVLRKQWKDTYSY